MVLTREAGKNDKLRNRLEAQQLKLLELPCIAHCHAEGHAHLQETLETLLFDYVVITSPEVSRGGSEGGREGGKQFRLQWYRKEISALRCAKWNVF